MIEAARTASEDDLDALALLAEEMVAEQAEARGGPIWSRRETRSRPYIESLRTSMFDPDAEIWVGTIDDVIVGFATAHVELLRDGSVLGIVDDVFVDPASREVGVGEELLDAVIAWCTERRCVGIDALALPGNRATKNFFETFGFTARLLTVHRRLEQEPPAESPR